MSWAEEDWTVGLPGRALQKVKELQVHQERLARESRQRQLQLDNAQVALNKQTAKYEEVRGELQALQRELQGLREEAKVEVCARQRLSQELQTKQAQVCSLEGQLDAARTLTHTLSQEVKRLEAELEKLQNSSQSGDSTLFSTPCWNMNSPWEENGGRKEERPGHRGEGDSRGHHVRQQLQFSDPPKSLFPRQQQKSAPHRHPSDQSGSFSTPSAVFPWERDDSRPAARGHSAPHPAPQTPPSPVVTNHSRGQEVQGDCGKAEDLRRQTDMCVSELRSRVCALEAELRAEAEGLRASQEQLGKARAELSAREQHLQRARNELGLAHTRITQESDRACGAEQRLKQLQEELRCQRQNAESSRLQQQQRTKELDKQHQRDLLELQKERQALERQQQQEVNKLNQELQQARTLHNALQAQTEKVSLQKQALEREVETLKEKLKWTEGQLQESQRTEAQTQAKLMEAQREAEGVALSLEQSKRREKALEEEGRRLAQERADALHLLKELQDQRAAPGPSLPAVQFSSQSFAPLPPSSHHPKPSAHTKRPAATTTGRGEREKEEEGEEGRGPIMPKYPTDREPGEGIDSEDIAAFGSPDSEHSRRGGQSGRGQEEKEEERKNRAAGDDATVYDSSASEMHPTLTKTLSRPSQSAAYCDGETPFPSTPGQTASPVPKRSAAQGDLQRENNELRSELRDVREELQKRLEDLEGQRQAEAEARTRLKQLSRKHASQAGERVEHERERRREREEEERARRAELEQEKAEAERLRKALASLEAKVKREREEEERGKRETGAWEEKEKEGKEKAIEDRESELIELNIQLKKQLAEVKAQLSLEREERGREKEEEERKRTVNKGNDLSLKLAELEAELEELKNRGQKEKNVPDTSSPLTYLTLHDDLNSTLVGLANDKLLPSPEQHRLFCQSANQRNAAVSQATADLIQEEGTGKVLEMSLGVSLPLEQAPVDLRKTETAAACCDLAKEVERLRGENAREAGRARQCRAKLEALQSQVTRQTQQLTAAFESQSQHITGLLAEVQQKESALLGQGEELQRARQELTTLRAEKEQEEEERKRKEEGERKAKEKSDGEKPEERWEGEKEKEEREEEESSELQMNHSEGLSDISLGTSTLTKAAPSAMTNACEPENKTGHIQRPPATTTTTTTTTSLKASGEHPQDREETLHSTALPRGSVIDPQKVQAGRVSACLEMTLHPASTTTHPDASEHRQEGGTVDLSSAELLSLKQENRQLRERLEALTVSDTADLVCKLTLQTVGEEDPADSTEWTIDREDDEATSSRSEEENACSAGAMSAVSTAGWELTPQGGETGKREGRGGEMEETEALGESGSVAQCQVGHLVQQVEALQAELQALGEEYRRQAEELVLWRLASQPAPTFDPQTLTQTDNQSDIKVQVSSGRQSQAQCQTHDASHDLGPEIQTQALNGTSQPQAQAPTLGIEEPAARGVSQSPGTVTVIREDELLFSCSSSRLYGRTLASSLQHSNCPEPKSLQPSKRTSAPPDYIQEIAAHDEESEKENMEAGNHMKHSKTKTAQHKEKRRAESIQWAVDENDYQHTAKDPHTVPGPQTKATEHHEEDPAETKPNAPRATDQISTTKDLSERDRCETVRSAGTQTEDNVSSADPARPAQLHHVCTQTEEDEEVEELADSPPVSQISPSEFRDKLLFSGPFPIPADPARLAERIRRNRSQLSAAFDDTEYEPYGLPEVVMKGFADIPSGQACPYIVRRGLLGTAAVPLPQKETVQREETD